MHDAIVAVYFMMPAFFANMAPVFISRIPFSKHINWPVDFKKTFRGKRILGDHKTFLAYPVATLAAFLVLLAKGLFAHTRLGQFDITGNAGLEDTLLYAVLFGVGTILGDQTGSFIKRRLNFKPGQWFPILDQTDWVVGVLVLLALFALLPSTKIVFLSLLILPLVTLLAAYMGVKLGLKSSL